MKKKILIIRSVSFQQLDVNMLRIAGNFPPDEYDYWLLTHTHGVNIARKYPAIKEIIDYGYRRNFSPFHLPSGIKKESFNAVIIPVTNITGMGFLNVKLLAYRCKSATLLQCNLVSQFTPVSRKRLLLETGRSFIWGILAGGGTALLALAAPFLLLAGIFKRSNKFGK